MRTRALGDACGYWMCEGFGLWGEGWRGVMVVGGGDFRGGRVEGALGIEAKGSSRLTFITRSVTTGVIVDYH